MYHYQIFLNPQIWFLASSFKIQHLSGSITHTNILSPSVNSDWLRLELTWLWLNHIISSTKVVSVCYCAAKEEEGNVHFFGFPGLIAVSVTFLQLHP